MSDRTAVSTDHAPAAIGPYSQAIRTGELLFCSGQIPLDPSTGEIVKEDVEGQAQRCLENLTAVCEAAGAWSVEMAVRSGMTRTLSVYAVSRTVLGGEVAVPCHPQSALVGLNSRLRGFGSRGQYAGQRRRWPGPARRALANQVRSGRKQP